MLDDNHHVDMVSALDVMGGGAGWTQTTRDRPSSVQYNSYTLGDELKDVEEDPDGRSYFHPTTQPHAQPDTQPYGLARPALLLMTTTTVELPSTLIL